MNTKQMIFMLAGALTGLAVGAIALLYVFRAWHGVFEDTPFLVLVLVAGLLVGGLVAGAYGAQAIIYRHERAKKKQRKTEKSQRKDKRRR